jgi:uncharacterized membrane protein YbhN (UPF0104 family)
LGVVTPAEAIAYVNIGYLANDLLPLRAGEAIRAVLLGRKRRLSVSAVAATIVLERFLDVLVLVLLTLLLMLAMPIPPRVRRAALVAGGVAALGVAGLWWAAGGHWPGWVASRLDGRLPDRLLKAIHQIGESFAAGLSAIRSWRQIAVAGLYSAVAWGAVCTSACLMMVASGLQLPWYAALMVVVVVNFGAAIPSSPGFIGVVHFLVTVALSPWAVGRESALAFAIVYHAVPFLMTVGLGAISMSWQGIRLAGVTQMREIT